MSTSQNVNTSNDSIDDYFEQMLMMLRGTRHDYS